MNEKDTKDTKERRKKLKPKGSDKLPKLKFLKKKKRAMAIVNVPQGYIPSGTRNAMKATIEEDRRNFFFR
jgi:hypothetical protein